MDKKSIKDYINSIELDRKKTIMELIDVIDKNISKGFKKVMN